MPRLSFAKTLCWLLLVSQLQATTPVDAREPQSNGPQSNGSPGNWPPGNWPQWRGPRSVGVAEPGDYPTQFSPDVGLAWKTKLPGPGSSTPAVWGDVIYATCVMEEKNAVCALDMQGKILWETPLGEASPGKHRNGGGCNPSPVVDGKRVVAYFKSGEIAGLDLRGNILWQRNLQQEYGHDTLWWDLGTSPVLCQGNVVVAVMHAGDSYLIAIDPETGKNVWKQTRQYERPEESDQAYTTPQMADVDGQPTLVVWGADHLTGHDPASGEMWWECDGFNAENKGYWRVIASAAVADGVAVVPYGRGEFLAGIRMSGRGKNVATKRLWQKTKLGADVPTPVIDAGRVYLLGDDGKITCLAIETGEEIWNAALPRSSHKYYASPVVAGDLLYCTREDGTIFVGRIGDPFELLAENRLEEQTIATPAPVRNGLLVRGNEHLFYFK